jgi:hypothetical protein
MECWNNGSGESSSITHHSSIPILHHSRFFMKILECVPNFNFVSLSLDGRGQG